MTALVLACLYALLVPAAAADTEPVDDLLKNLYDALDVRVEGWNMRVESGLSAKDLLTAPWQPVKLAHSTRDRAIRYRTTVRIPEVWGGAKVSGGPAILSIPIEGSAEYAVEVSINGVSQGSLPIMDPTTRQRTVPPFTLTDNAQPGQTYAIEILLRNSLNYPAFDYPLNNRTMTVGPATLELPALKADWQKLDAFRINIESAWMLTKPWREFMKAPRPWSSSIDKRPWYPERVSMSTLDPAEMTRLRALLNTSVASFARVALRKGDTAKWQKSGDAIIAELAPIGAVAKQFTVYLVGNAHIDLAWLWRTKESVAIAANTYRSVLKNMEQFPELIYAQSQAQTYAWVEEHDPELFARIKEKVKEGKWDIVGGMWAEPDCNLIGGESWVRQMLQAQRYFMEHFGVTASLGWNPDSFGYNGNMPLFYSKGGIRAFITQKISWNEKTRFPFHLFWWESADGSRILTYLPPGSYVEKVESQRLLEQALNLEDASGIKEVLALIGFGDHGGGPNIPMLERARILRQQPLFPKIEFIRAHDYIEKITAHDLSTLPVWKDELYLETHQGTFTSQAMVKKFNRSSEMLLETAEKIATSAWLKGMAWPAAELQEAWRIVLLNQFHDILPGSSITPVYVDARETYTRAQTLARRVIDRSLATITAGFTVGEKGWARVPVYNSLSWERDGFVRLPLPDGHPEGLTVLDAAGVELPSRILPTADGLGHELVFHAEKVPALGLKVYSLRPAPKAADAAPVADPARLTIENEFLRVSVHPESGYIVSLVDKTSGRELIAAGAGANVIELRENMPSFWDAWNIGYTGRVWTLDKADKVRLLEDGGMRSVIRVEKSFLGPSKANWEPTEGFPSSFFVQDIILWKGSRKLDLEMHVDWWEDHILMKVAFPFAFDADKATYEIPYGAIERTTLRETVWQQARAEVPVHRWADISADGFGVALLNDSKYGMDTEGATMRLSMLTSPLWPDPMADRGKHTISYAIYPHAGDWRSAAVVRQASEVNTPLVASLSFAADSGDVAGLRRADLVSLDAANAVITTIKKAEDDDGIIVRIVETAGNGGDVALQLRTPVKSWLFVDLLERPISEGVAAQTETIRVTLKPFGVASIKLQR